MKASEKELEQHSLIIAKNDLALSKLFDDLGEQIVSALKNWYVKVANMDEGLILEAVNEAFWGYYKNPETFNPNLNTLHRFLEIVAERDLKNILEREKKHLNKKNVPENVELADSFWNRIKRDNQSTDGNLLQQEALKEIDTELSKHFKTERDRAIAKYILSGERKTEVFSKLLNMETLDLVEQKKQVKKHKDRIKAILDRHGIEEKIKQILL
ncbi:MAG: hypothetical protein ACJ748_08600 [Flavisolibacter sp.]